MTTAGWRRFLVGLGVFGFIQFGVIVWMNKDFHGAVDGLETAATTPFSATGAATGTPFVERASVEVGSYAYRAGLRTGDLADLRHLSATERYRWFTWWQPRGHRIDLPVVRGARVTRITLIAQFIPLDWDVWVAFFGIAWMLAFGVFISWRCADIIEGRILALLLILLNVGNDFFPINWVTPWAAADAIVSLLGVLLYFTGIALFATYASTFGRPINILRRVLLWLSYAGIAGVTIYGIAYVLGVWNEIGDPAHGWYSGPLPQLVTSVFPYLFPLLCVVAAIVETRGAQRTRLVWASAPLGLVYVISAVTGAAVAFNPGFDSRLILYVINASTIIAPLGLTYSLLSRRVLDIGFVLNRALVFSSVSLVVVGIFVLVEWMLTEWLGSASHTANLTISAALALALGLSVRAIHHYVDRALDRIFFRKRHEDEKAIRTLAHEAAYITDVGTLVTRAKQTLETRAGAAFVDLALDDGAGRYGDVSENDGAIVALKAWHNVVDLHTVQTGLRGEFAYPMSARGRLVGALVLGPKRSGESYAPDESDAIAQLAHSLGNALDVLSLKAGISLETLSEQLRDLRDAIVAELRATRSPL